MLESGRTECLAEVSGYDWALHVRRAWGVNDKPTMNARVRQAQMKRPCTFLRFLRVGLPDQDGQTRSRRTRASPELRLAGPRSP